MEQRTCGSAAPCCTASTPGTAAYPGTTCPGTQHTNIRTHAAGSYRSLLLLARGDAPDEVARVHARNFTRGDRRARCARVARTSSGAGGRVLPPAGGGSLQVRRTSSGMSCARGCARNSRACVRVRAMCAHGAHIVPLRPHEHASPGRASG